MSFTKCFDVVDMVVQEATNQFKPIWKLNNNNYDILQQYCSVIDSLVKEFNGSAFDVSIIEPQMKVLITITCEDLTLKSSNHNFYRLAARADSVGFTVSEDGELNINFVFPSLWDKV